MNRILIAMLTAAVLTALLGCTTPQPEPRAWDDPRAGTDLSPYRTIPVVIQCDDCRYEPDQ